MAEQRYNFGVSLSSLDSYSSAHQSIKKAPTSRRQRLAAGGTMQGSSAQAHGDEVQLNMKKSEERLADVGANLDRNASVVGRLLEELSWRGETIKRFRQGGRGYENVLTTEAFLGLDLLPRTAFLGAVVASARGANDARTRLIAEIEGARITLLPGNHYLIPSGSRHQTKLPVQPDGLIESDGCFALLEAKGFGRSAFQPEQLAREYILALRNAQGRAPLLMIITPESPPFRVKDRGKIQPSVAVAAALEAVMARAEALPFTTTAAAAAIDEVVAWTTWGDVSRVVRLARDRIETSDESLRASIARTADAVIRAIAWHAGGRAE